MVEPPSAFSSMVPVGIRDAVEPKCCYDDTRREGHDKQFWNAMVMSRMQRNFVPLRLLKHTY